MRDPKENSNMRKEKVFYKQKFGIIKKYSSLILIFEFNKKDQGRFYRH